MIRFLALVVFAVPAVVFASENPVEIDPNTKIQGGADVRGSGANAGAGARDDSNKMETKVPRQAREEPPIDPDKDKPISERKPQERDRDDAAQGETRPKQKF